MSSPGALHAPLVALYEDRPANLIGVKLAVASLRRNAPGLRVAVTTPGAPPSFLEWLARQPQATSADIDLATSGWDVKPSLLLEHLRRGEPSVTWLDSDVIVTGDIAGRLAAEPKDNLVSTEDVWWGRRQGTPERTLAWGLEPARVLPVTVNTALVRVAPHHVPVLEAWKEMLESPQYRQAQRQPLTSRPMHLWGDQEALTALLGHHAWEHVEVSLLRRGLDIAQCYGPSGFSPHERWSLHRHHQLPVLVHAMGPKPWSTHTPPSGPLPNAEAPFRPSSRLSFLLGQAHRRLSPYSWAARRLADDVDDHLEWACQTNWLSDVLERLTKDDPLLSEMPLAVLEAARLSGGVYGGRLKRHVLG